MKLRTVSIPKKLADVCLSRTQPYLEDYIKSEKRMIKTLDPIAKSKAVTLSEVAMNCYLQGLRDARQVLNP